MVKPKRNRAGRGGPSVPTNSGARAAAMPSRPLPEQESDLIIPVYGNTSFGCTAYAINGGLASMFPWASNEGRRFEKYRIRALEYEYVAAISQYDSNAGGNVAMAIDFDALDAVPTSMVGHQQNRVKSFCNPYDSARIHRVPGGTVLRVPTADLMRRGWLYNRSGAVPSGADQKTYDLGNLLVAVSGSAATTLIGNIFVRAIIEYDVQQNISVIASKWGNLTGLDADSLVGTVSSGTLAVGSNAGWTQTDSDTFTCTVAGSYLLAVALTGTVMVGTSLNVGSRGSATVVASSCCVDSAQTSANGQAVITATVGQTFKPAITSATTVSAAYWRFSEYNAALL